jgi:hypothetical protein
MRNNAFTIYHVFIYLQEFLIIIITTTTTIIIQYMKVLNMSIIDMLYDAFIFVHKIVRWNLNFSLWEGKCLYTPPTFELLKDSLQSPAGIEKLQWFSKTDFAMLTRFDFLKKTNHFL